MVKLMHVTLMVLAVIAVAIGDVFLKKAALTGGFTRAMTSPWMAAAIVLYLYQIIFFTYAFLTGWQLSVIGSMQTALYALIILGAGVMYFNESLSIGQGVGVVMAFGGIVLMNIDAQVQTTMNGLQHGQHISEDSDVIRLNVSDDI